MPAFIFSLLFELSSGTPMLNVGRFALVPLTAISTFIPGALLGSELLTAEQEPRVVSIVLRGTAVVVAAYPLLAVLHASIAILTHIGPTDNALYLFGAIAFGSILFTCGGLIFTASMTIPIGIATAGALVWLRKWWHQDTCNQSPSTEGMQ